MQVKDEFKVATEARLSVKALCREPPQSRLNNAAGTWPGHTDFKVSHRQVNNVRVKLCGQILLI